MRDPRGLAQEEGFAHGITKDILEDYLEDNCFDPSLSVDAKDMKGVCGESLSSVAKLKYAASQKLDVARQNITVVMNSVSDWLYIAASAPVTVPANGETEVALRGDCICCDGTAKNGDVRVYGGPGHSVLIGKDDVNMGCAAVNKCAGLTGDPHVRTYDGLRFDFQGAGEFVMARGEGFEVQARMEAWEYLPVSLGTAAAVRVNSDVVGFYIGPPPKLVVSGLEWPLNEGGSIHLPGGGLITRDETRYRVTSPDGLVVEVQLSNKNMNLWIGLPFNTKSVGVFGSFDGDRANDIRLAGGSLLAQPVDFEGLYKKFGGGWRVTDKTSLFHYGEGESAATFNDPSLPSKPFEARNVSSADRTKAEAICRKAGITDAINLDNCILDVGVTGDVEFAALAAKQPSADARLEVRNEPPGATSPAPATPSASATADGVSLDAPAEEFASHSVTVEIKGNPGKRYYIGIAPEGSDAYGKVVNPYSELGLNGDETSVDLIVPIIPGEYELRYMDDSNPRKILLRQPLRSLEPKVRIEAPVSGEAGKPFEVRLIGNVGKHMYVAIVPVGSPDGLHGRSRGRFEQGTDVTSSIYALPEEPGNYEIRCSSYWGDDQKQVHARRRLTVY